MNLQLGRKIDLSNEVGEYTTDVVCGYPSDVSLHNPVCVFLSLLKNRSEHRAVQAATLANMLL